MGGQLIQRQLVGRLESGALFFCDVRDRGGREVAQLPCADGKISRLAGRAGGSEDVSARGLRVVPSGATE